MTTQTGRPAGIGAAGHPTLSPKGTTMTNPTEPIRLTADPDRGGFILHLPDITYLDTQVWSVDVGLTDAGLSALRKALASSVGEAEAALAPLEAAVRGDRRAQQTGDRTALRDRVRRAICEAEGFAWDPDMLEPDEYGDVADAVLAVLPEPTDQTAVDSLRRLADEAQGTTPTTDPIPLRWGLDDIEHGDDDTTTVLLSGPDGRPYWLELNPERANALREALAETDEQPTTPTAAHPPEHRWAAELYDPDADEWVPGTRFPLRERAVAALDHGRRVGPTWKDGTPTQRRLVRETKTYTVEPEPAGPAAPAKDTPDGCTCAVAGDAFAPAGHYADCPAAPAKEA